MSTVATMEPTGELFEEFTENLPVIYEKGEPTAILLDIHIFKALLQRLDALEERELLSEPEVIAGLRQAREDHLTGRLTSHIDLVKELGLELGRTNELSGNPRFRASLPCFGPVCDNSLVHPLAWPPLD